MTIRKFVAPTTREAMMQVRRELGDDAVIIANRRVGNRIEILAAEPDAVEALVERSEVRAEARNAREPAGVPTERVIGRTEGRGENRPKVEAFQDFVRRQMEAEGDPLIARAAERAGTREVPPRAAPANANTPARSAAGHSALAMYQDVADIEDDADYVAPRAVERAAPRRAQERNAEPQAETSARREARAATLPQSHRAPQIETPAEPAVFRRRPAHVASTTRVEVVTASPAPRAAVAAPPVDIVLDPGAAPLTPGAMRAAHTEVVPPANIRATPEPAAPIATGHADVPSLPIRSQAAPIATAARLREASINAALAARAAQAEQAARVAAQAAQAEPAEQAAQAEQVAQAAPQIAAAEEVRVETQPMTNTAPATDTAPVASAESAPAVRVTASANDATMQAAPVAVITTPVEPVTVAMATTVSPAVEYAAPVVQIAPIAPVALANETPAPGAAVPAWEVQFTTRVTPVAAPVEPAPVAAAEPQARMESALLAELQSMRDLLREQIATLATKPAVVEPVPVVPQAVSGNAAATRVTTRLLTAGFSADVARRIAVHAPAETDAARIEEWLQGVLTHNIRCIEPTDGIVERSGRPGTPGQVFALVGPTGVGKTTTVAKLAARFAVRHGTSALGLITLDAYRVAAPEQLRAYGRILGTPVHVAQDAATLRELLATMVHKRLVLIDTCGLSQRDERLGEMLDLLAAAGTPTRPIQRVLLMNSASHAETLDDAARAWRAGECVGAILTKLDEAARIGGSLDATLRHRLTLLGLTNGQRVPEDWHVANGRLLAHLALKPAAQLFDLADDEGAALIEAHTRTTPASANAVHG